MLFKLLFGALVFTVADIWFRHAVYHPTVFIVEAYPKYSVHYFSINLVYVTYSDSVRKYETSCRKKKIRPALNWWLESYVEVSKINVLVVTLWQWITPSFLWASVFSSCLCFIPVELCGKLNVSVAWGPKVYPQPTLESQNYKSVVGAN